MAVRDNTERRRFEMDVEGGMAFANYRADDSVVVVTHTEVPAALQGKGAGSRFVWREEIDLPLGRLGRLGWPIVKPLLAAGVALSLRRFARFAAARTPSGVQNTSPAG